jgi:hypothetical protein
MHPVLTAPAHAPQGDRFHAVTWFKEREGPDGETPVAGAKPGNILNTIINKFVVDTVWAPQVRSRCSAARLRRRLVVKKLHEEAKRLSLSISARSFLISYDKKGVYLFIYNLGSALRNEIRACNYFPVRQLATSVTPLFFSKWGCYLSKNLFSFLAYQPIDSALGQGSAE